MKFLKIIFAAAMLLALWSPEQKAQARSSFSFGYYGPGVGIHIGRYPYYGYRPHYYQPHYYRPYYYPYRRYYSRPYTYRSRRSSGRCGYWSRRCAANWGYRNSNYYGCLRYHRCR